MNDDELRSRFDVLVDRVPANIDAVSLVRTRANRIRRRRSAVVVGVVAVVVASAVALPEILQHQAKSHASSLSGPTPQPTAVASAAPTLTTSCTPSLTKAAHLYGQVQHLYGLRASVQVAAGYLPSGATVTRSSVDFCLVVGDLDRLAAPVPPGVPDDMHYAVLADSGQGPRLVSAAADLTSPMLLGVDPSAIARFRPTTPAAVRACTSADLTASLTLAGYGDAGVQIGYVEVVNSSATACSVRGDVHGALLDAAGHQLANGPHLPAGALAVDGVLTPSGQRGLRIRFGADQPPCSTANETPARLVVRVGAVQLSAANEDVKATQAPRSLSGCSGGIYADSAQIG